MKVTMEDLAWFIAGMLVIAFAWLAGIGLGFLLDTLGVF